MPGHASKESQLVWQHGQPLSCPPSCVEGYMLGLPGSFSLWQLLRSHLGLTHTVGCKTRVLKNHWVLTERIPDGRMENILSLQLLTRIGVSGGASPEFT